MPTFICERCGAIENTALSDYWYDVYMNHSQPLCSKCKTGTWHGQFPRQHWSKVGISACLALQKCNNGDMINAREHLRNIGVIGSKKHTHKEIPWDD